MQTFKVSIFKPYPFKVGQKIRIKGGKRQGDWEVVDANEFKVSLRCPITNRQFEWERFCYIVQEKENEIWPEE
ncbi:MAG: hypothetical protein M0036_09775 [Desulfobacteraceae bacterium]|nr:hypothetical protein [Desulfobacteraceae bacterium]